MERWARLKYQPVLPLGEGGTRITESAAHRMLSKDAAKEGMVLLKNEGNLLPLAKGARIALFGKATFDYVKGGGGSGDVTVSYVHNLYDGLSVQPDLHIFEDTVDFYRGYVACEYAKGGMPGMIAEPALPADMVKKAAAYTDTAIISLSRYSGEGWDRTEPGKKIQGLDGYSAHLVDKAAEIFEDGDFYLSRAEQAMVEAVTAAFPKVIVLLNVGGMVDTKWFAANDKIKAAMLVWQGGMEGGLAEAELLVGKGNPSGKLSDTFAADLKDYPSTYNFHESLEHVDYTDDIYVGYRYFETIPGAAEKVIYPFGFGLSYTTFAVTGAAACAENDNILVTACVTNTGCRAGREVVQVYYGAPQGKLGKPAKVLAGYKKTRELAPGESEQVFISFPVSQMASYDDLGKVAKSAYVLEKGSYAFFVGTDVRSASPVDFLYTLEENVITEQLTARMVPSQLEKRMLADGSYEALPQTKPHDKNENGLTPLPLSEMDGMQPAVVGVPRKMRNWRGRPENDPVIHLIDVEEGKATLDDLIAQLTDEELANMLGGQPDMGVSNTFGYGNLPSHGIPNATTADGPAGLRIMPGVGVCTTAFPIETLLCCTWDPEVVEKVGYAGAMEVKENNIAFWLTPAVCIHRSPMCGRNFEYFSEDPLLAGRQAAAKVRGIQAAGIGATPKHFALNDKETNRKECDSRASERAIREIYLKQFEIIVKESDPWSIMSSYNVINGHRASENYDLLTGILRDEWGYKGFVTTDWWTAGEHYKEVKAGNDVKMGTGFPERLLEAKEKGLLSRKEMETCAKRILGSILRVE